MDKKRVAYSFSGITGFGGPPNKPPIKLDRLALVEDGTCEVVVLLRFMDGLAADGISFVHALLKWH